MAPYVSSGSFSDREDRADAVILPKSVMVAVDYDKNSRYAVKWAIENLLNNNSNRSLVLVHVRVAEDDVNRDSEQAETEVQQLFATFHAYCSRKRVQTKEVVLNDNDISNALVNHIKANYINAVIVGEAKGDTLAKWNSMKQDVATGLKEQAPEFCSVYVIAKTKVAMVQPAEIPVVRTASALPSLMGMPPPMASDHIGPDGATSITLNAMPRRKSLESEGLPFHNSKEKKRVLSRERASRSLYPMSMDNIELSVPGTMSSDSLSNDAHLAHRLGSGSVDISAETLDFSTRPDKPRKSRGTRSRKLEADIRKLKLELQQTMEMYSRACKEALAAKQKAKELDEWKMEEVRKREEAFHAEETALAIVEMEKGKCKAAIEAAEVAHKLAELEAQKRRRAESLARKEAEEKHRAVTDLIKNDVRYRKYMLEEIKVATDEFSEFKKIGEGGYGPVYKGCLDHTPVAIKVLRPDATQGRRQFNQEIEILCSVRHPNMVLLLGACPEYGCLIYEYMENGSLEDRLRRKGGTPPVSWRTRFTIAAEIATALLFMHHAKPEPLVHRDLKPANILIDRYYVSKISDVGLARLVPPSVSNCVTQYRMTSAAGTFCYIDPEYQQTGKLTTKSDIYSLGILLLQIITAKPPMGITHYVARAIDNERFEEVLDPSVPDWPVEEALSFAKMALKCAELRKKDRPDLSTVVLPELSRLRDFGKSN